MTRLDGTLKSLVAGALCAAVAVFVLHGEAAAQQRVFGVDVSYWQSEITPAAWDYANDPNNSAPDRVFAIVRSSRGGTTGESDPDGTPAAYNTGATTLSRRYDDPRFLQNMSRAHAEGLITAPYHFARPDILTNTGGDEADHFMEMAGVFMRPGYMLPMYDLEAAINQRTPQELADFSLAFSNRIYEVMKIRPSIYASGSYFDYLSEPNAPWVAPTPATQNALSQPSPNSPSMVSPAFPMFVGARYPAGSGGRYNEATHGNLQTTNPDEAGSFLSWYYGSFDNYGDPDPWHIWQYSSGEAPFGTHLPGIDQGVDGDVAHGDMEYLRDRLVPAVWMNDLSGNWSETHLNGTPGKNWNSGAPVVEPEPGENQAPQYEQDPLLPVQRLPGAAGTGPTSGQYDTVILERPTANITVTLSTGTHNIRKMYMRESLNITGGTLTINYDPTYRPDTSTLNTSLAVRHAGPISAQFSGAVTLGGTGALSVHTLQVDPAQLFTLAGGTLTFNKINLRKSNSTPAKIVMDGSLTINPLNNATATIQNDGSGSASAFVDLTGGTRTFTVGNGTADVDLHVDVPIINGGIIKSGLGTMLLGGNNTFAGPVTVGQGTLRYGDVSGLSSSSVVTVNSGATLDMNNTSDAIAGLAGGGAVTRGTANLSIGAANGSNVFSGETTGTGALTKTGASSQTFSGVNTLGAVNIDGGALLFNNTTTTGAVNVNNGGALGGTGSISGAVTVHSGGKIVPGPAIGDFDVPSLTMNAGSSLEINVSFLLQSSRVEVADLLTIDGGSINILDPNEAITAGNYTIIDYGTRTGDVAVLGTPTGPAGFNYSLLDTGSLIRLVVSEIPVGVSGDFNDDGVVDAADYVVWAKFRDTSTPLPNDDDIGGVVGEQHYDLWKTNFGSVFEGSGGGQDNGVVPEPSIAVLSMLGICALVFGRRVR